MSELYIRNLFPDPRMRNFPSRLYFTRCRLDSSSSVFEPSAGRYPGLTLEATEDGDNWAAANIPLPANARLVLACRSSGSATSNGQSASIWTSDGVTFLTSTPQGENGPGREFTVPSNGQVKVTFRAAKATGGKASVFNVFIGSLSDYRTLEGIGTRGFLAWDLMPYPRS